jgi:sodium-coupled neutral amino acid transporter 11
MKVRFDIPGRGDNDSLAEAGHMNGGDSTEARGGAIRGVEQMEEDEDHHDDEEDHDAPLLPSASTPIDAALENPADHPTSSLQAAISNMSNSILGAGIIGQPYALKEAGLAAGVILLVVLTVVVDWTIRLIVINSKMSGRNTFQGTVEFCFGWWGCLAISLAQWAFAFGGMVAFAVIVGDSIPPVLEAVWPGMSDIRYLGWLATRSGSIMVFILGISWPLSLYRDISKVSADPEFLIRDASGRGYKSKRMQLTVFTQLAKASTLALFSMLVIVATIVTQGFSIPAELRGTFDLPLWTINVGIFQAIGVISFGLPPFPHPQSTPNNTSNTPQPLYATTIPSLSIPPFPRQLSPASPSSRTLALSSPSAPASPWPSLASSPLVPSPMATCSTTSLPRPSLTSPAFASD